MNLLIVGNNMRNKVELKPEQYSKEDIKYSIKRPEIF